MKFKIFVLSGLGTNQMKAKSELGSKNIHNQLNILMCLYNKVIQMVQSNVLKPDPNTEPDDLPGHRVIRSTADEPRVSKLNNLLYDNILATKIKI